MTSPYISAHGWTGDPSGASLRLTTRGRTLLLAMLALGLCSVLIGAASSALTAAEPLAAPVAVTDPPGVGLAVQGRAFGHTVVAGDTLWDLAIALDPGSDPRPLVDRIQQINGMSGSELRIGSVLWLPVKPSGQHDQG